MLTVAELRDPGRCAALLEAWLLEGLAERIEFIRGLIAERNPPIVLCDAMSIEGVVAAECSGVPWIGVSSTLVHMTPSCEADPYDEALRVYEPLASEAMRHFGVTARFRGGEMASPALTIMGGAREWAPAWEPNQTLHGHLADARSAAVKVPRRFPEWPLVVVSFGSYLYLSTEFVANFARAAESMEVEFLVSARHFARDYRGSTPPNFVCHDSIPQVGALHQAALLVTHGGAHSIQEAIAHAVPILVVPLAFDQFRNAELVRRLGVGSVLDARAVSPSRLREAIDDALSAQRHEPLALRQRELTDATGSDLLEGVAPFLGERDTQRV